MNNCPFCNIDKNKIARETDHCYVIYDDYPVSKGHMLVIPKRHVTEYFELHADERKDVENCISFCRYQNDHDYNPDGYNIGMNIGEAAGQTINHCHIHVIPRYKGDMEDPRGGVRGVIPSKQKYTVKVEDSESLIYKRYCFEYIMMELLKWYEEWNKKNPDKLLKDEPKEYFTRIRVLKILFLLSVVNEGNDLLDMFDKFYAMINGPVESDIYNAMINDKFRLVKFKDRTFNYQAPSIGYFDNVKIKDKQKIDQSLKKLKEINFELIDYSIFELIRLSQSWDAWRICTNLANILNKSAELMDTKLIRGEQYKKFTITRTNSSSYFIF